MKLEVNSKPDLCSKVNYHVLDLQAVTHVKFQEGF